jgi:Flp pilus assembly protein TadG
MKTPANHRFKQFAAEEDGGMTVFWMFGLMILAVVGGLAVDITNLHRHKERLTLAVDAGAQAGIVALAAGKSTEEVKAAVLASVEVNAPLATVGKTSGIQDVEVVRFDPKTKTLVPGTPNAVKVTLHNDETVDNPVRTGLLRLAGVNTFDIKVSSVAYYGQPGNCTSSDMIYGKGQVTLTSGNVVGPSYCVHSQTAVWLPQQNTFETGAGVSMPNLASCKGKCVDTANPGIEDAVFAMNLNLTNVAAHITKVRTAMLTTTSDLKTAFFANKTLATSAELNSLVTAKVMNNAAKNKLVKGSVVDLTAAQYNDLMSTTNGKLPSGLVYNVDCRDKGNGPATAISIGAGKDRKNATLTSTTIETVRQVALITDCGFDVGPYARVDAALAISTRVSSSSVINAAEGSVIGDPLKNCDLSRKVYMMTMSGVSVNADFTASNIALIANGDINVAANSNSSAVVHKGTSLHAEGSVQIPANNTFNSCAEDNSGLIPSVKTFKFVAPKA